MPAPYTPLAVANQFIASHGGEGIEHMKLQKLVYYSYGWWLASMGMGGTRLTTEGPQIWKHGPVFQSLYHALSTFGRRPIHEPQAIHPFAEPDRVDNDDHNVSQMVDWIWGKYGHLSSFELSDMTHRPGSSWYRVATENDFRIQTNTVIPDEYIFAEFRALWDGDRGAVQTGSAIVERRQNA